MLTLPLIHSRYAVSLGDFKGGGELCVEIAPDTVAVVRNAYPRFQWVLLATAAGTHCWRGAYLNTLCSCLPSSPSFNNDPPTPIKVCISSSSSSSSSDYPPPPPPPTSLFFFFILTCETTLLLVLRNCDGHVQVDTHGKIIKLDGRYPHWVTGYAGTRYSIVWYRVMGDAVPQGDALPLT